MGDQEPDEAGYGLVYPFVCVASVGGPWDDQAFVAGARFGQIVAELKAKPRVYETTVEPDLVSQLDLLAMHEGYSLSHEEAVPGEWEYVTFTSLPGPAASGTPDEPKKCRAQAEGPRGATWECQWPKGHPEPIHSWQVCGHTSEEGCSGHGDF